MSQKGLNRVWILPDARSQTMVPITLNKIDFGANLPLDSVGIYRYFSQIDAAVHLEFIAVSEKCDNYKHIYSEPSYNYACVSACQVFHI